jgi:hypothetical protein|tara:strand:- start:470 stop:670 length:201 start_codon:yes stop_codon:yes gene_type:complete
MQLITNNEGQGFTPRTVTLVIQTQAEADDMQIALSTLRVDHISDQFSDETRQHMVRALEVIAEGIQ